MKIRQFEQFCADEKLTPTIEFVAFGTQNNKTLMFWKIEMKMEGQLIASVECGAGLEVAMLQVMIECLEMKFEGLGYSSQKVTAEVRSFIERMVAA